MCFNYTTTKLLSKILTSILGHKNNRSVKQLFKWLPKWNDVRACFKKQKYFIFMPNIDKKVAGLDI